MDFSFDSLFFSQLVQAAPDAIIVINQKGKICFANYQAEALFGYGKNEFLGELIEKLIPEEFHVDPESAKRHLPKICSRGNLLDLTALRKDGNKVPVEISLSPLESNQEKFFLLAIRNTSEKKKQIKNLKEANEELEHFVFIASHDLQEPLTTVLSLIEEMRQRLEEKLSTEEKDNLKRIVAASQRMKTLIADLLSLSRIGRVKELSNIDCQGLLDEVLKKLEEKIKTEKAQVRILTPLPKLSAIGEELILLFQILIENALKFRSPDRDPVITIDVKSEKNMWHFSFQDNGIGIDSKYYPKLFAMFQKLHARSEYSGNGIGLAHCKKIVKAHKGEIWISSKLGEGSTFHFTLPQNIKTQE